MSLSTDAAGSLEALAEAVVCEERVRRQHQEIQVSFLRLGHYLKLMRDRRLFELRGYESFRDWVESPEVDIPIRKARELIRVIEDLEPALGEELLIKLGASKARALLPLVERDVDGRVANAQELLATAMDVLPLTWRDTQLYVRELRGREPRVQKRPRFMVEVFSGQGDSFLRLHVAHEDALYCAGNLRVRREHLEALLDTLGAQALLCQ